MLKRLLLTVAIATLQWSSWYCCSVEMRDAVGDGDDEVTLMLV